MFKWVDGIIEAMSDWVVVLMLFITVFMVMWSYTRIFLEVVG